MFHNNRPRYWVAWFDRWFALLGLLFLLLLCILGYILLTTPAPTVTLQLTDPSAALRTDRPIALKGTTMPNGAVRLFDGDKLLGETRADASGAFQFSLPDVAAGAHSLKASIEANGAQIESPALSLNVSPAIAAQPPTPTATAVPPTATPTRPPATPTATSVPPTATLAPPTVAPTLAAGAVQRRGKDNAEMVYVPAGEFTIGSDTGSDAEKPSQKITLDAFWMDKYEVTNEQFQQFVSATSYKTDAEKGGWGYEFNAGKWGQVNGITWLAPRGAGSTIADKLKQPVGLVSWNDANAYCTWAGKQLPTEAQWEKTARGTDGRVYPWGNAWDNTRLNSKESNVNDKAAVGNYPQGASAYGALDMAGNAWEWVADWFAADGYKTISGRNPTGPAAGQFKVLRGGAWTSDSVYTRASSRFNEPIDYRERSVGFRCAQS